MTLNFLWRLLGRNERRTSHRGEPRNMDVPSPGSGERPLTDVARPDPEPQRWKPAPPELKNLVPLREMGLERVESRSRPGRFYYRNNMPDRLPDLPILKSDGLFGYRINSAVYYQAELAVISGGRRDAAIYYRVSCILRPEPDNPHDPDAVVIMIGRMKVGHLQRGDTRRFLDWRTRRQIEGDVQCRAQISGGAVDQEGRAFPFDLNLDLAFPIAD